VLARPRSELWSRAIALAIDPRRFAHAVGLHRFRDAISEFRGSAPGLPALRALICLGSRDEVVRILQVAENRGIARIREVDVHLVHLFNARLGECLRLFFEPSRRRYATFWYPLAVFLIFFALAHCARLIADALPATLRT
jgi:hypothetical protein